MRRYLQFVLQHRRLALAIIFSITAAAGYTITKGVLASSVIKLFFGDNPEYTAYRELANEFGGNDVMVIAFEDDALLTPQGVQRLRRITDAISSLEDIVHVDSLISANRIRAEGDDLIIEPYLKQLEEASTATGAEALRMELIKDPLLSGLLISRDGRAFAVLAELGADPDRPIEVVPKILEQVVDCFIREGYPRERLHLAGLVPESTEATEQAKFTLIRIFPITVILLAGVVFALFLRFWPVLITGGVALISIVWTLAFAILLDPKVNLLMAMVPGMMTVIAFSDIIHLYSAYVRERMNGMAAYDAVLKSGSEVGTACLYTSMTTFVGFASIAFVPTPVLRQLGVVLGAGVGIALLLALTLVPIILSLIPQSAGAAPKLESKRAGAMLDALVGACLSVSTRRPWITLGLFTAVIAVCLWGASRIEVEASFSSRLSEDNHIRRAQRFIQERFAAANFLDVYLIAKEGNLLDQKRYAQIERYTEALSALPDVQRVLSPTQLFDLLHAAVAPDKTAPKTGQALAQYLLLFEVSGGEGLRRFVNEERTIFRLSLRLGPDGMRRNAQVGNQAAALAEEQLDAGVRVKPTGITYLFGDWLTFIVEGQKRGLLFAIFSTTLMMIFCLRSLRVGLLSMIPNLLPLIVLGGYVGLLWKQVDSDTILIATFAIGIAVDDTIHFLTRLRFESQEAPEEALKRTFFFTGRAIVQTTVILCIGFLPFAMSDYFSTRIIGTLLPMTLVVALIADLLLVPALVQLGVLRFNRPTWPR